MDFTPYARPYLERLFASADEGVETRLTAYANGWSDSTSEQFLVQDFAPLPAPNAPAMVTAYIKAHLKTLALSRLPAGLLMVAVHCPSLLRRDIAFEIAIVLGPAGIVSARLTADPRQQSELSLFLLGMGSLRTLQQAMASQGPDSSGR